jgi:hypothetical protein
MKKELKGKDSKKSKTDERKTDEGVVRRRAEWEREVRMTWGMRDEDDAQHLYIRSKCCVDAWMLVWTGERYELRCAKCSASAGSSICVSGPDLAHRECECCANERGGHKC